MADSQRNRLLTHATSTHTHTPHTLSMAPPCEPVHITWKNICFIHRSFLILAWFVRFSNPHPPYVPSNHHFHSCVWPTPHRPIQFMFHLSFPLPTHQSKVQQKKTNRTTKINNQKKPDIPLTPNRYLDCSGHDASLI
ncbi:uncharacterized protein LY79DRAFT_315107 [Colletotrichum navitas]|uniref:Uncharacterized protein n=1 Tax=Colletotrichum navitas TaxID=681940 RepID=A0AAD8PT04_9PEZI|nr:uncharacterized protein LY79DRAFT_315107 [Colletotrichum navitas]KAK1580120.1 hypothetical protein LY79DRAFT_315107 [Colletotrichum navitas]